MVTFVNETLLFLALAFFGTFHIQSQIVNPRVYCYCIRLSSHILHLHIMYYIFIICVYTLSNLVFNHFYKNILLKSKTN